MKKNIAFNLLNYSLKPDGISIYSENYLLNLKEEKNFNIIIITNSKIKNYLSQRINLDKNKNISFRILKTNNRLLNLIEINFFINFHKFELVFTPSIFPLFCLKNISLKVIHDFTFIKYPFSLSKISIFYKKLCLISIYSDNYTGYISKTTLKEMETYFNTKNFHKIYLPNGLPIQNSNKNNSFNIFKDNNISKKLNFIFVGSKNFHKGLDKAIIFIKEISINNSNYNFEFNIIGKKTKQTDKIIRTIKNPPINLKVYNHNYLSNSDLDIIYQKSHFSINFSSNEGFGLNIVESIHHGVIPLLSYIDSFIEITENNYFYMKNINLFPKQFWKIIMNKNLLSSYCLVLNKIYEDNKKKYLDGVNNLKKVINEL